MNAKKPVGRPKSEESSHLRSVRLPEGLCARIQESADNNLRSFNSEVMYQLYAAYGKVTPDGLDMERLLQLATRWASQTHYLTGEIYANELIAVLARSPSADGLCPNCLSPWKCNGPHVTEAKS